MSELVKKMLQKQEEEKRIQAWLDDDLDKLDTDAAVMVTSILLIVFTMSIFYKFIISEPPEIGINAVIFPAAFLFILTIFAVISRPLLNKSVRFIIFSMVNASALFGTIYIYSL